MGLERNNFEGSATEIFQCPFIPHHNGMHVALQSVQLFHSNHCIIFQHRLETNSVAFSKEPQRGTGRSYAKIAKVGLFGGPWPRTTSYSRYSGYFKIGI